MGFKKIIVLSLIFILSLCFWGCDSTKETIEIEFDTNGGIFQDDSEKSTITFKEGENAFFDWIPQREGYTFVEWRNETGLILVIECSQ